MQHRHAVGRALEDALVQVGRGLELLPASAAEASAAARRANSPCSSVRRAEKLWTTDQPQDAHGAGQQDAEDGKPQRGLARQIGFGAARGNPRTLGNGHLPCSGANFLHQLAAAPRGQARNGALGSLLAVDRQHASHLVQPRCDQLLDLRSPFPLLGVVDKQDAQGAVEALRIGGHVFIGPQEPCVVGQQVAPVAGFGLTDPRPQGVDRRQHAVRALHPLGGVGKAEVLPHRDPAGAQQQGHSQQECGTPKGRNQRRQRVALDPCSVAGQPWGMGRPVAVQLEVQVRGQKTWSFPLLFGLLEPPSITAGRHLPFVWPASPHPDAPSGWVRLVGRCWHAPCSFRETGVP